MAGQTTSKYNSATLRRGGVRTDGVPPSAVGNGGSTTARSGKIVHDGSMPVGGNLIQQGTDLFEPMAPEAHGGGSGVPKRPGKTGGVR